MKSVAKQHNPNHDLRVPYSFYLMPIATQVMYRIIRAHLDKYARADIKYHSITYSRWCDTTHTYIKCSMTRTEAQRVYNELYPPAIVGRKADIIITDDLAGLDGC